MYIWRITIVRYQESIVDCYYRIVNCEENLPLSYEVKLRRNVERDNKIDVASNPEEDLKKFSDTMSYVKPKNVQRFAS